MSRELLKPVGRWFVAGVAGLLALAIVKPAPAQTGGGYDLTWNVISGAGGGESCTGTGSYSLNSTIGQAAAGTMTGGSYTLTGGFWALQPAKPGDINGDNAVNVSDLQLLVASWAKASGDSGFNAAADFNCDDRVNVGDLQVLVAHWGT